MLACQLSCENEKSSALQRPSLIQNLRRRWTGRAVRLLPGLRSAAVGNCRNRPGRVRASISWRGGRTTLGVRLLEEDTDLWALRGDDPDKTIAGRTWTTEVVTERGTDGVPRLSLRLLVSTGENELRFDPHVPGLLQQVAKHCGLRVGGYDAAPGASHVQSADDFDQFIAMLESPARRLPVFVASGDEHTADPDRPLIEADRLARATLGLAHVVVLPAAATYSLSDAVGKLRSVFHGAVRVYMPGFDTAADPYQHRLILADTVRRDPEATLCGLQAFAATESLRRTRLGHDVVPFAAVRSQRAEQEARASSGASAADQLAAAKKSLEALTVERDEERARAKDTFELAYQEEERAHAAESQLRGALARIEQLKAALTSRGQDPDAGIKKSYPNRGTCLPTGATRRSSADSYSLLRRGAGSRRVSSPMSPQPRAACSG